MAYVCVVIVLAACTGIAFVYRWSEHSGGNRFFMSAGLGLGCLLCNGVLALAGHVNILDAPPIQFLLGGALGAVTTLGTPVFMAAVARGDLSITWTVMTLSFALASLAGIIFPGETVGWPGVAGLLAAVIAVVFLGIDVARRNAVDGQARTRKGWAFFISIAFLTNAYSMYSYTLASHFTPVQTQAVRLAFMLSFAAVLTLGALITALIAGRRGSVPRGLGIGAVAGVFMFAIGFFMLMALNAGVPAYVLYPATTGGSNILVAALSVLLLRERPSGWGWIGIVVGTAALVLLGVAA